jgi:membrane carboxypeptidase/penicillin-binding protein PbpC
MRGVSGVTGAAPIWRGIMLAAHAAPPAPFERPDGLVEVAVCGRSGLLPGTACQHRVRELFLSENVPTATCALDDWLAIDTRTGEPAAATTPEEWLGQRHVINWPAEALAWADEQGLLSAASEVAWQPPPASPATGGEVAPAPTPSPVLVLTRPDNGSRYQITGEIPTEHQQIEVSAQYAGRSGESPLVLWLDGQPWHTWDRPPYRVWWALTSGSHEFWVTTEVDGLNIRSPSVGIRVQVPDQKGTDDE